MNQPVLSHLVSVPYIIPSKQKRAIERNANYHKKPVFGNVNQNGLPQALPPRIEVEQQPITNQMTDSELLQASIARDKLELDHAMAKEAAMQQILQAQNNVASLQSSLMGTAVQVAGNSGSDDLLDFKSKLNSLKMITDPVMR